MTNEELLALVLQHLEPLPVTARSMFGGRGLYLDGRFFGVIFDGVLYFRTDDEAAPPTPRAACPRCSVGAHGCAPDPPARPEDRRPQL